MGLFSLERVEIIMILLREIFELDSLQNLDLNRLEIYTSVSLKVVRKLITCVTKASKKLFYKESIKLDLDFFRLAKILSHYI